MRALRRAYVPYFFITLTVVIFNLIAVFGPIGLLHDDPAEYVMFIQGSSYWGTFKWSMLDPLRNWFQWHVIAYSPYLMRAILILLWMVPISCCLYYIYRSKFKFSQLPAFVAAVLPNILPSQWEIPAGINMSYSLDGLLFSLLSLISGYRYLEESAPKQWTWLFLALVCYFISSQLMEQALFLFPPLVLAFIGYTKLNRKHIWLLLLFFAVALARFVQMIVFPRKPIADISLEEMLRRIELYAQWSFPVPDIPPLYLAIFYVGVITLGFILHLKNPAIGRLRHENFSHLSKKFYVGYLYIFFICWSISTIIVFVCFSQPYRTRYIYISVFGLNAVVIWSVYTVFNEKIRGSTVRSLCTLLLVGLVIFSGIARYRKLEAVFSPGNEALSVIVKNLKEVALPENSQIVICGILRRAVIPEGWLRSSGQLKYLLQRNDITGLLVSGNCNLRLYSFDDHFNPHMRYAVSRYAMTGLSPDRPVFLFIMNKKEKNLKQLTYALQWRGESKEAAWTIFQTDQTTGKLAPFLSGTGLEEYLSKIRDLAPMGISPSEILWGGPLTEREQKRLESPPGQDPRRRRRMRNLNRFSFAKIREL